MPRLREEQRTNLPLELRKRILRESGYRCAHCNTLLKHTNEDDFSIEHVVPLRKGGTNNPNNLIALCRDCNKEKQDDILEPRGYYVYAPEWKLEEICKTFDDYIQNIDWMAYDTLFKLDRFEIKAAKSLLNKKSHKIFHMPATYQVRKMRRIEVNEYLTEYTGHLDTLDKQQMAYEIDEINTNYYRILGNSGQTIMIITPYILNTDYGEDPGKIRTTIFVDFFINPNIPFKRPDSHATMAHIIKACLLEIRATVEMRTPRDKNCIDCIIRAPYSDKNAQYTMDLFQRAYYPGIQGFVNGDESSPRNINFAMRFYNGSLDDLVAEAKAANTTRKDFEVDIQTRQDNIKTRLEKSREVKAPKIKKVTKKEKKSKGKKPKRHK